MKTIEKRSSTIGGYYPERTAFNGHKYAISLDKRFEPYLPVVKGFQTDHEAYFEFYHMERANESICNVDTYYRGDRFGASREVVQRKYLDVSRNDLTVGSDRIFINLTNRTITTNLPGELRKTYLPLDNRTLRNLYGNVVMIIETTAVSCPNNIADIYGVDNYLESMIVMLEQSKDVYNREKNLEIYRKASDIYRTTINQRGEFKASSIKVINILILNQTELEPMLDGEDLFIKEYNMSISTKGIINCDKNPLTNNSEEGMRSFNEVLKDNHMVIFINDPDNAIGKRYTSNGGFPIEIPKTSRSGIPSGLYIKLQAGGEVVYEEYLKFEDMDKSNFVYKTKEEATNGADKLSIFKREVEELKATNEKIKLENDFLRETGRKEAEKLKIVTEKLKIETEQLKIENDRIRENMKTERAEEEAKLSKGKYFNEHLGTVLKIAGSVVGLIGVGMAIVNKLSKPK